MRRHWIAALSVGLSAMVAQAQTGDSHAPLDGGSRATGDVARQLANRFNQPRPPMTDLDPATVRKLVDLAQKFQQSGADPKQFDPKLLEQLSGMNLNDPRVRQMIEAFQNQAKRDGGAGGPANWQEMLQRFQETMPRDRSSPGAGAGAGPIGDLKLPKLDPPRFPPGGSPLLPKLPRLPDLPRTQGDTTRPRLPGDDWLNNRRNEEWKNRFDQLPDRLRNSEAMRRAMEDLSRSRFDFTRNSQFWREGAGGRIDLSKLEPRFRDTGRFLERSFNWTSRNAPSMPRSRSLPNAPTLPRAPTLPGMNAPSIGGGGGIGNAGSGLAATSPLVIILVVAVFAYLIWRLILQPNIRKGGPLSAAGLGPWPIDPAHISTREQLVRAVDHLALLKCGEPARVWHYRTVATHLGTGGDDRRTAADSLADAYAAARYAPPSEAMPDATIQQARRHLCHLAGDSLP